MIDPGVDRSNLCWFDEGSARSGETALAPAAKGGFGLVEGALEPVTVGGALGL